MNILKTERHTFEIVKELPKTHIVWNIGRHNFDFECYIPLCTLISEYNVNVNNLKAYKVNNEKLALKILKLAGYETVDYDKIKKLIESEVTNGK